MISIDDLHGLFIELVPKNSIWRTAAILKIVSGHNSACSRLSDFSEILHREAIFTEFQQWDRYLRSTERIFCFHNAA